MRIFVTLMGLILFGEGISIMTSKKFVATGMQYYGHDAEGLAYMFLIMGIFFIFGGMFILKK